MEYVAKHREEEGWMLAFSRRVPGIQCFFPSLCSQMSWTHRSLYQPQIFFFPLGHIEGTYFTPSPVTAESNSRCCRISIIT